MARGDDLIEIIAELRRDVAELKRLGASRWGVHNLDTAWGEVGSAQNAALAMTGITTVTDITGLSVTWTADPTRIYETTATVLVLSSVSGDRIDISIRDAASATLGIYCVGNVGLNLLDSTGILLRQTGLSGSTTRKLSVARGAGTGNISVQSGATFPAQILVKDIGAA
jgi:hypothetical protein